MNTPEREAILTTWRAAWPGALELWSRFTKLREPHFCFSKAEEKAEQLSGSFAMIRLTDQVIVISLAQVLALGLQDYPLEVMGHEIGHHVYCPADLTDEAKLMARIRNGLPTLERFAGLVSNLYTDLLINDRLARYSELRMGDIYARLSSASANRLWTFYMRMCEILWSLPRETLAHATVDKKIESDAMLGARLIRVYANDWLRGAGGFAALCFDYVESDAKDVEEMLKSWLDTHGRTEGGMPDGLTEIDDDEEAVHPSLDEAVSGVPAPDEERERPSINDAASATGDGVPQKRYREPSEYADILKSVGVKLSDDEIISRYYRERATPHLIRFPSREMPQSTEPLPESLEAWDAGEALEELDIAESVILNPQVIPGYTTMKRVYGTMDGTTPHREPLDLYVGIDCSGSMGNPRIQTSFPILAGTIVALSALRAGSRVKVVLSGEPGKFVSMKDFSRDEKEILTTLTSYLGTGYAFGIHRIAETFDPRKPSDRPVHILIVTDHDIFAMLKETSAGRAGPDARRTGWDVARDALVKARGGATYVLNMPVEFERPGVKQMQQDGWSVSSVRQWEDIVAFAREFSRKTFGEPARARRSA
jgi:hypothetical protein